MPPSRPIRFTRRASHRLAQTSSAEEDEAMFGRLKEQPSPQSQVGGSDWASQVPDADGGGSRSPEGLILILFTIATLVISALVLHNAATKSANDPVQKAARGEIKGLDELSFFHAANLRKALAKVSESRWP